MPSYSFTGLGEGGWNMTDGNRDDSVYETTFTVNLGDVELNDEERAEIQNAILESVIERVNNMNNLRAPPINVPDETNMHVRVIKG
jgi:hypothetical protein